MTSWSHQKLIQKYNLNVFKMPLKLKEAIWSMENFKKELKADNNEEAKVLLKKLDENLTLGIYDWMVRNENNLGEIIKKPDDYYKDFYYALIPMIAQGRLERYDYWNEKSGQSEDVPQYELSRIGEDSNGHCSYFELIKYWGSKEDRSDESFIMKICEEEQRIQPISYQNPKGETLYVFDYYSQKGKINAENRSRINFLFQTELRSMMINKILLEKVPSIQQIVRKLRLSVYG